ncbi:hypothetical protein RTBOTA2_003119 [Rhodotorula toruloides]|nr:hypothetical protein RTBOTA2_003119 [Rhodotorula toruloides]
MAAVSRTRRAAVFRLSGCRRDTRPPALLHHFIDDRTSGSQLFALRPASPIEWTRNRRHCKGCTRTQRFTKRRYEVSPNGTSARDLLEKETNDSLGDCKDAKMSTATKNDTACERMRPKEQVEERNTTTTTSSSLAAKLHRLTHRATPEDVLVERRADVAAPSDAVIEHPGGPKARKAFWDGNGAATDDRGKRGANES